MLLPSISKDTMSSLFCCDSIQPYRPKRLEHEVKFNDFMAWARLNEAATSTPGNSSEASSGDLKAPYAVQLVRQVNYGPLENKRYFIPVEGQDQTFAEVKEDDLIQANFQKLNSCVILDKLSAI